MADDLKVNSNTDILEFKRKFNLFVSNYDKGEFDGDFEITGDLTVDGDVEIKGELKGADSQIANAVSDYITAHPFAPEMLEGQDIEPDDISATGKITGAEIIENMTGYTVNVLTSDMNWTPIYLGVCKNGNKLTFVIFGKFTYVSGIDNDSRILYFNCPSDIVNKLYPYSLSGRDNILDAHTLELTQGIVSSKSIYVECDKSQTGLDIILRQLNNSSLVLNDEYLFRYEVTFLLSENLYNQE